MPLPPGTPPSSQGLFLLTSTLVHNHSLPASLEAPASTLGGLVVDDDPILAQHAAHLLRRYGIADTAVANSVDDARNVVAHRQPKLVICDLHMPEEDGFHLLELLGERCPSAGVVVCSAHSDRIVLAATEVARSIGFSWVAHLPKPLSETRLFELLDDFSQQTGKRVPTSPVGIDVGALASGDFVAWFQPQVLAADATQLFGLEALVRWRSPDGVLHAPGAFLDAVTQHGLEPFMLQSIVPSAFDLLHTLRRRWPALKLSLNVSPELLASNTVIQWLVNAKDAHRLPAEALTLELTEAPTSSHAGWQSMLANAARLRFAGIGLSIDDFGTRESSAERAALLPITEVKIDKLFVHTARRFSHARAMLGTLRSMAASVGAITVVEGIESEADLQMALEMGFDVIQGFYISWPLSADQALARYA